MPNIPLICLSLQGNKYHLCSHMTLLTHVPSFLSAVPTAELEPITETYVQSDEVCCHTKMFIPVS